MWALWQGSELPGSIHACPTCGSQELEQEDSDGPSLRFWGQVGLVNE